MPADERLREIEAGLNALLSVIQKNQIDHETDVQELVEVFLESRSRIGAIVASMARMRLTNFKERLAVAVQLVEVELRRRYASFLDNPANLVVRGYNETHAILLASILSKPNCTAYAQELRFLVNDQVHTERRLRDLRDLGFDLQAIQISGQEAYQLVSSVQDVDSAVMAQLRRLLQKPPKNMSVPARNLLSEIVHATTGDQSS